MRPSLEFILGLIAGADPACASFDDFLGPHAEALRLWQQRGFLASEPEPIRVPSCPHCREGVPIGAGNRLVCVLCLSEIDRQHLRLWRFDVEALLGWLARELRLDGELRPMDGHLWQLGGLHAAGVVHEFFFGGGHLSDRESARLTAYRYAALIRPLASAAAIDGFRGPVLSLLDVLRMEGGALAVADVSRMLGNGGAVRFDEGSGGLWAGEAPAGEVPVGTKEHAFLAFLAENLDRFVPYADLKHEVLRRTGSTDSTDEATFCQKLKNRIKTKWVPEIDRLIVTTNKGDGYRLRGRVDL
jgi:hypothetical protein